MLYWPKRVKIKQVIDYISTLLIICIDPRTLENRTGTLIHNGLHILPYHDGLQCQMETAVDHYLIQSFQTVKCNYH